MHIEEHGHETTLDDFDGNYRTSSCNQENKAQIVDQIAEDHPEFLEVLNRRDIADKFDEFLTRSDDSEELSYDDFEEYIQEFAEEQEMRTYKRAKN